MEATELNRNARTLKVVEDGCVMTRVFDAPRELVFEVWTSPRALVAVVGTKWLHEYF